MEELGHNDVVSEFLKLLKSLRAEQNLTLEQLADLANVHRTTVGLLEREERSPTLQIAQQLSHALGHSLSELVSKAELMARGERLEEKVLRSTAARLIDAKNIRNADALLKYTGLESSMLIKAIESCYHTLDTIDEQLIAKKSPVVRDLVELANLSSMIGNLVASGIADNSDGLYKRNRPHAYPDLIPLRKSAIDLELKMALETNKPKGHLPKAGNYITFRYVLGDKMGRYTKGKESRGNTAWIWEVKIGCLEIEDFSISNTEGDSGKTAVIKTDVFNKMPLVYFDPSFCPHKSADYPGYN